MLQNQKTVASIVGNISTTKKMRRSSVTTDSAEKASRSKGIYQVQEPAWKCQKFLVVSVYHARLLLTRTISKLAISRLATTISRLSQNTIPFVLFALLLHSPPRAKTSIQPYNFCQRRAETKSFKLTRVVLGGNSRFPPSTAMFRTSDEDSD